MPHSLPSYFHMHLISDSTGDTLTTIAKAACVQYQKVRPIEHVHPMVRNARQLERVLADIEEAPGIVLYTLINRDLAAMIETRCRELSVPCLYVLDPIMRILEAYLGAPATPVVAGQHVIDASYFRRIDALNFTMAHDDGRLPDDLNTADIILLGISRTSKTPTSIYLAQKGFKTANVPLIPGVDPPRALFEPHTAFVVGLVASAERIADLRRNRLMGMVNKSDRGLDQSYVDRASIAAEVLETRRLCARQGWAVMDVTRRSVEETAAAVIRALQDREEAAQEPTEPTDD